MKIAKRELMTSLSAVEFMDWESASIAMDYLKIENPLNEKYKFYLLVEMSGNTMEELMQEQMLELLEKLEVVGVSKQPTSGIKTTAIPKRVKFQN
jgi:hypothetical protein